MRGTIDQDCPLKQERDDGYQEKAPAMDTGRGQGIARALTFENESRRHREDDQAHICGLEGEMTIAELIKILDAAAEPNQGLSYHNGSPQKRYDSMTGEPYMMRDPTHLYLFGRRAENFYRVIESAKMLANELRALSSA
ncbi:MAG: hypothetical protein IT537_03380 [Hyphomicrobiales bacterium]|nr:hypothetical protein [Hyphomicrobiales bacterium]